MEYESVLILVPNLSKKEIKEIIDKVKNKINELGEFLKYEDKGIKQLAYTIKKYNEGYYIIFNYNIKKQAFEAIKEIEKLYRITDEILKFITVKVDKK